MPMPMAPSRVALLMLLCGLPAGVRAQQEASAAISRGQQLFDAQCARCHGIGGTGGLGANLRRPTLRRAPDDTALFDVIRGGIPDRGMPDAWQLSDNEVRMVAKYVRSLGQLAQVPVPGNADRGRALYANKGGCPACHVINGEGGAIGPDLSEIGGARGPDFLQEALLNPGASLPAGPAAGYPWGEYARFLLTRAVTASGESVLGVRVNEDAFTIQIRDQAGRLHSLVKSDLRQLDKQFGKSLMPNYTGVFTADELQDLGAWLSSLRGGR
jgi:putative heme-binding domain-containing protein